MGRKGLLRLPQGNREGFVNSLKHLYRRLKGYTIWLYVDRAKWHQGEEVDLFIHTHVRLRLKDLLGYQPSLNIEERIWRHVRYDLTTNHWFESLDAIWETVDKIVHSWSPKKIKQLCQLT